MINYQNIYESISLSCKDQAGMPVSYRDLGYAARVFFEEVADAAVLVSKDSLVADRATLDDLADMARDIQFQACEIENAVASLIWPPVNEEI